MEQHHNIGRHLRSLPQESRLPYDWAEFRYRASRRTNAHAREGSNGKKYAAVAAAFLLVIVGVAAWIRVTRPGASAHESLSAHSATPTEAGPPGGTPDSVGSRADAAERWLVSLPNDPVVVRVGTRAAVAGLEDRIAQLDDFLSAARVEGTQPAKLVPVEEQRARLVSSLVQVRYAETLVSESR